MAGTSSRWCNRTSTALTPSAGPSSTPRRRPPRNSSWHPGAYLFAHHLPAPVLRFRAARPAVPVILRISAWSALHRLIERGDVDVAVLAVDPDVPPRSSLEFEPLFEESLCLLAPADHPLARAKRLRPEQLAKSPLILPPKGGMDRKVIDRYFRKHNLADLVRPVLLCGLVDVVREYVRSGLGVALMYLTEEAVRSRRSYGCGPSTPVSNCCRLRWQCAKGRTCRTMSRNSGNSSVIASLGRAILGRNAFAFSRPGRILLFPDRRQTFPPDRRRIRSLTKFRPSRRVALGPASAKGKPSVMKYLPGAVAWFLLASASLADEPPLPPDPAGAFFFAKVQPVLANQCVNATAGTRPAAACDLIRGPRWSKAGTAARRSFPAIRKKASWSGRSAEAMSSKCRRTGRWPRPSSRT